MPTIDSSAVATKSRPPANQAWLYGTLIFIFTLSLYVATMCRTVFWWDTGELAANIKVLGIPHRPGFPLYVLIGRVFSFAPFGEFFYRVNFFSAFSAATALGLMTGIVARVIQERTEKLQRFDLALATLCTALSIAGTYTLWMQAVRAEVYAPTLAVIVVLIGMLWRFETEAQRDRRVAARWLPAIGLVAGLGLALHSATTASALPAIALFALYTGRRARVPFKAFVLALVMFALGMSVYLYMPIRAAQEPLLNWGWLPIGGAPGWKAVVATDAWSAILSTGLARFVDHFWLGCRLIFHQWEWGLILLTITGVVFWWRSARRWMWLALGIFVGNLAVTAVLVSEFSETNADIHGYLLPGLFACGFFLSGGVVLLMTQLRRLIGRMPTVRFRQIVLVTSSVMVIFLAVAPVLIYAPFCNLVGHHLAYDFGTESTVGLEPGGVILLAGTNWDFVLRGLQYCDAWRPDLTVLNRDLLPAAWYRHWMSTRFPELANHPIPADSSGLLLNQWALDLATAGLPVYYEFTETDMELVPYLVPAGHLFRLSGEEVRILKPDQITQQEDFERHSQFYGNSEALLVDYDAQMVYVSTLYRAGLYYESRGLYDRARKLFRRALSLGQDDENVQSGRDGLPAGRWLSDLDSLSPLLQAVRLDVLRKSP